VSGVSRAVVGRQSTVVLEDATLNLVEWVRSKLKASAGESSKGA